MNTSSSFIATDGQPASLFWCRVPYLGSMTRLLLLSHTCDLHVDGRLPWREDGSVIYSYNLLSLSGPSPAELMTTFYCLYWDHIWLSHTTLPQLGGPDSCIYTPQEQGGPVIPPGTGFPFCRLLRLARLRWRYSNALIIKVKVTLRPTYESASPSWRQAPIWDPRPN
jgi:hypothetical protein